MRPGTPVPAGVGCIRPGRGWGLQLAVIDDGIGFDPAQQRAQPQSRLASMRERVLLVCGELDIESAPGRAQPSPVSVPLEQRLKAEVEVNE